MYADIVELESAKKRLVNSQNQFNAATTVGPMDWMANLSAHPIWILWKDSRKMIIRSIR